MRNLPLLSISLLLVSVSCGDDGGAPPSADSAPPDAVTADSAPPDARPPDASPPDAPPMMMADAGVYDFSCVGAPADMTAPDPLTFDGIVTDFVSGNSIDAVLVEALSRTDNSLLASDTTDATGAFALSYPNPTGAAVDGYVKFSKASYSSTYIYPPDPIGDNIMGLDSGMIPSMQHGLLYLISGAPSYDPANGTAIVAVIDCLGNPISGATVDFSPAAGDVGYLMGMMPSASATETDASGVGIGFNVPPGINTVSADYMGMALESHTFESFGDSITVTIIHP